MSEPASGMPAAVLVLCRDLLFSSKISATAQAIGVPVTLIRDPSKLNDHPHATRLLVDLTQDGFLDAAAQWKATSHGHVTGFAGHTDTETLNRAEAAGLDSVLSRGAFAASLPRLLKL